MRDEWSALKAERLSRRLRAKQKKESQQAQVEANAAAAASGKGAKQRRTKGEYPKDRWENDDQAISKESTLTHNIFKAIASGFEEEVFFK